VNTNIPTPANITTDQKGQAMLEFAFSIIILVLLYLVIITVGLRIGDLVALNKVARDGGREAAITGDINQGQNKASDTAWAYKLDPARLTVSFTNAGDVVICEARYRSTPFADLLPGFTGNTETEDKNMTARAVFGWWDYEN